MTRLGNIREWSPKPVWREAKSKRERRRRQLGRIMMMYNPGRVWIGSIVLDTDVRTALRCRFPSVRHRTTLVRARLHPSGLQQLPRHLSITGEPPNSSFPARLTLFEVLGDLARKLEFSGLAGDGKRSGKLLESARVEARPHQYRTVAK
ncbi:hypothetical protein ACLB2K_033952 [Fragaria x ananassa]